MAGVVNRQRQLKIMDILRKEPTVLVKDLAVRTNVHESTIRRDLDEMEAKGLVRRIHGGAILEDQSPIEPLLGSRQITHKEEKDLVGRAAGELVRDGEIVFIDGGTTTLFIVPYILERKGLTVVTCGLNIACALASSKHISTIVLGGELHAESQSFAGPLTLEALKTYGIRCDRAFISAGGVSADHGVTNRTLDRIPLKRKAMEFSQKIAVVADGSKLGVVTLGHVAPVESFHYLVTDKSAPERELEAIAALGVRIKMVS
ncbi:MAG: DeoR/GlpR transcriptional regulator [Anaerolineales bacterium]|nr:DeoR/GlpR transcriptional regulator [Anaerolineales bacterium]